MNLWEALLIALRGLGARRVRSALTMLGLIIGVAAEAALTDAAALQNAPEVASAT